MGRVKMSYLHRPPPDPQQMEDQRQHGRGYAAVLDELRQRQRLIQPYVHEVTVDSPGRRRARAWEQEAQSAGSRETVLRPSGVQPRSTAPHHAVPASGSAHRDMPPTLVREGAARTPSDSWLHRVRDSARAVLQPLSTALDRGSDTLS